MIDYCFGVSYDLGSSRWMLVQVVDEADHSGCIGRDDVSSRVWTVARTSGSGFWHVRPVLLFFVVMVFISNYGVVCPYAARMKVNRWYFQRNRSVQTQHISIVKLIVRVVYH
jgi:hypothetical protein